MAQRPFSFPHRKKGEKHMMAPRTFEQKSLEQKKGGPVTPAGKEIVSKNALVHGLAGRTHAALAGEEELFAQHCRAIIEAFAPVGAIEQAVPEDIAEDRWRLKRARAMENALFARIAREQSQANDPVA